MLNQVYSSEYKKLILAHVNQKGGGLGGEAYATVIFKIHLSPIRTFLKIYWSLTGMFLSKYIFNLKMFVLINSITKSILKMCKQQMITKKKPVTSKTYETKHLIIVQTLVQL